MKDILKISLSGVVGALIGALASRHYYKKKYKAEADAQVTAEIESIKNYYETKLNDISNERVEPKTAEEMELECSIQAKDVVESMKEIAKTHKEVNYGSMFETSATVTDTNVHVELANDIRIVSDDEAYTFKGPTESLVYYSDGVLAEGENGDQEIFDPENTVGDCLEKFDEDPELYTICVLSRGTLYEISRNESKFSDIY